MIDQIETNLYKLELPLPENPLRSINCYLIKGPERFLLIDTGMNRKECLEEIDGDLRRLRVDLNHTDFLGLVLTSPNPNSEQRHTGLGPNFAHYLLSASRLN